jgi:hypothetical protein
MNIFGDLPRGRRMPNRAQQRLRRSLELAVAASGRPQARGGYRRRGLVVAAAAVGAATALMVVQPWAEPAAYASWTAVPDRLDAATTQTLGAACSRQQETHFKDLPTGTPLLGERRGKFTAVLVGRPDSLSVCVSVNSGALGGLTRVDPTQPETGLILDADPSMLNGPDAFRVAYGRVSPDVTKVVIKTRDGRTVTASTAGRYFLCWWPSSAAPYTITATGSAGQEIGKPRYPAS